MKQPLRSIFLKAAEYQLDNSRFSCDNLTRAINEADICCNLVCFRDKEEVHLKMYRKMFKPKGHWQDTAGWWSTLDDSDNEARIYALLLCAEMLRR